MKTIAFLVSTLIAYSASSPTRKIVGGEEATLEEIPFILELEGLRSEVQWGLKCGAVLLTPNVAVTAGHCVYDVLDKKDHIRLLANSTVLGLGYVRNISEIILHENFTIIDGYAEYDIGLVRVDEPFEITELTKPISIATEDPADDKTAVVAGWGTRSEGSSSPSRVLLKTELSIYNREECAEIYDGSAVISDRMICAGVEQGGQSACFGDSGGPLTVDNALVGLVSFAIGCAEPGYPGAYTDVAYFAQWIQDKIDTTQFI